MAVITPKILTIKSKRDAIIGLLVTFASDGRIVFLGPP